MVKTLSVNQKQVDNTSNKSKIILNQNLIGTKNNPEYFLSGGVHDIALVLPKIAGKFTIFQCSLYKLEIVGLKKDRKKLEVEFAGKYMDSCFIHDINHCSFVNTQLDSVSIFDVSTVLFIDSRLNKCKIDSYNLEFRKADLSEINKLEVKTYNLKLDLTKKRQWQDIVDFVKEYCQENDRTLLLTRGDDFVSKQFVTELVKEYLQITCKVLPNITIMYENQSIEIVRRDIDDFKAYIRNW